MKENISNNYYLLNINKLLKLKKINQRELAGMLKNVFGEKTTQTTVSNHLSGKTKITVDAMVKIADVLDVEPCVFFKEEEISQKIFNNKNVNIGEGNSINVNSENNLLKKEIELLEKTIKDKEQIIELLTNKK